jgi:hypothetical protein
MPWFSNPLAPAVLAVFLCVSTPALGLSFIGCDNAPSAAGSGPDRDWHLCKTTLRIADARGRGAAYAQRVAIAGSKKYVILKVHGSRPDILKRAETTMRELVAGGYTALGVVLADGDNPTVMEVFSGGRATSYDVIRNVDAYNGASGIREVVTEAYRRDIGPRQQ